MKMEANKPEGKLGGPEEILPHGTRKTPTPRSKRSYRHAKELVKIRTTGEEVAIMQEEDITQSPMHVTPSGVWQTVP